MEHTHLVKKSSACSRRHLGNRTASQDARPESNLDYSFIEMPHLELELEFEVAMQRLYITYEGSNMERGPRSRNAPSPHYSDHFAENT